jgi:Protein of Unknown function (DUF2784)
LNHIYALAAAGIVLLHSAWILFVVTGAYWLRRYRRWRLLHLLAVVYSVAIEIFRWICPLTYAEQALWGLAGEEAYQEAFLTHYLERLIYAPVPQWLLVLLAVVVLSVTLVLYSRPLPPRRTSGESTR